MGARRPGGFARVYLGAHNPLDVAGGFGLGLAIGGAVNLALGVPAEGPDAPAGDVRSRGLTVPPPRVAEPGYPPSSTGAPTSEPYSVHDPS